MIRLDAYKILRNSFISTFKRDKMGNANRTIIGAGNAWAHGGDAVVDASLYYNTGKDRRRGVVVVSSRTNGSANSVLVPVLCFEAAIPT